MFPMSPEHTRQEHIIQNVEAMRHAFSEGYMAALQNLPRWTGWSLETDETGGTHKVPHDPATGYRASIYKPERWGTLAEAIDAYARGVCDGIGVYLLSPYVLVDMDGSFNPVTRKIEDPRAGAIVTLLNSCTEVSPRKKGTHTIVEAIPPGENFRLPGLEVYTNWFATVTTWHVPNTPTDIMPRQEELDNLYRQFAPVPSSTTPTRTEHRLGVVDVARLSELPPEAHGDQKLHQLLAGISLYGNTSVDEFVALMKLMHYTGDDRTWTKAIFSASPIGQRAKAREDTKEGRRGDSTYLDYTIDAVLRKRRNPPMKR